VDRGKPGSKMNVLSDAKGLPLVVGVSAANVHDSLALKPMVAGHQTRHDPHRGRYSTMPQRQCFRPYARPTLTLVQMRQQHLELRSQGGLDPLPYQNK